MPAYTEAEVTTHFGSFRIEGGESSMRVKDVFSKCVGFVGEVAHRDSAGVSGDLFATGFFVSVPSPSSPALRSTYFVTAKHVAKDLHEREAYFLVNKLGGGTTTMEPDLGRWWTHPTDPTADVAVTQVSWNPTVDVRTIADRHLANDEDFRAGTICVGDEVFITGLFTEVEGNKRLMSIVRHGNIAMLPDEQIQTELGFADVFLVEARSIGGISGSPVFARPTLQIPVDWKDGKKVNLQGVAEDVKLLGLMHGHWAIREAEINNPKIDHDRKRGVNLGIGIVVPAAKILETINQSEVVELRKKLAEMDGRNRVPGMDSARSRPIIAQSSSITRDQFETALKKASRKITPKHQK